MSMYASIKQLDPKKQQAEADEQTNVDEAH
jgi:hypothetical protein